MKLILIFAVYISQYCESNINFNAPKVTAVLPITVLIDIPFTVGANLFCMKKIYLSQHGSRKYKELNLFVLIDDEDFDWLNQWNWSVLEDKYTYYATGKINGENKNTLMHRLIMDAKDGQMIDHMDGSGFNNQRNNLRICNKHQNGYNAKKTRGISKYKGVTFNKKQNIWVAQIQFNGKHYHIGHYKTEKEAAISYNESAKKHHGEFARLNIINDAK